MNRRPIVTRILQCSACGESREFNLYGPAGVHTLEEFERKLRRESELAITEGKAWVRAHQHGATEHGIGTA